VTNLGAIKRIRLLESLRANHLINSIVVFRILLVLLSFLVACLALVFGVFLGVRMPSVTSNTDEIGSI